jgi:hypothetical protein
MYKNEDDFNYKNNSNKKKRKKIHSKHNISEIIDLTLTTDKIISKSDNSIINLLSDDDNS